MANPSKNQNQEEEDSVMYKECWRNHAVQIGGYAADGCGEFIPKGNQGTKEALVCEACGCHRNFHRKEVIKNGITLIGSHHLAPIWNHNNSNNIVSISPCNYYKLQDVVSDEESVICSGNYPAEMETSKPTKKL